MKDRLKEEIQQRRPQFEVYEPDLDQLWEGIDSGLKRRKAIGLWSMAGKMAAAVAFIVLAGWLTLSYEIRESLDGYALYEISPELAETELYYSQQVAEKLQIIRASNTGVDQEVMQNLQALDSAYLDLKRDLKENVDNEEVVTAMINNYRIRLAILEQILTEINHHDQNKESDEVAI